MDSNPRIVGVPEVVACNSRTSAAVSSAICLRSISWPTVIPISANVWSRLVSAGRSSGTKNSITPRTPSEPGRSEPGLLHAHRHQSCGTSGEHSPRIAERVRLDERDGEGFEVRSLRCSELRTPNFMLRLMHETNLTPISPVSPFPLVAHRSVWCCMTTAILSSAGSASNPHKRGVPSSEGIGSDFYSVYL
jgi:hypothetical protein